MNEWIKDADFYSISKQWASAAPYPYNFFADNADIHELNRIYDLESPKTPLA